MELINVDFPRAPPTSGDATTEDEGDSQHVNALLPKQTLVRIVGNNRTKGELVGRQGLVKSAQTLGGWHEVLLENGNLVRVQRNALQVLSMPLINSIPQVVAPMGIVSGDVSGVKPGGSPRPSMSGLLKRRSRLPSVGLKTSVKIDKLDLASLRRYRRVFKLNVRKDCTRDELVFAVRKHFAKVKVNEKEVLLNFVRRLAPRATGFAGDREPDRDRSPAAGLGVAATMGPTATGTTSSHAVPPALGMISEGIGSTAGAYRNSSGESLPTVASLRPPRSPTARVAQDIYSPAQTDIGQPRAADGEGIVALNLGRSGAQINGSSTGSVGNTLQRNNMSSAITDKAGGVVVGQDLMRKVTASH